LVSLIEETPFSQNGATNKGAIPFCDYFVAVR
jgi:hypothetical protein